MLQQNLFVTAVTLFIFATPVEDFLRTSFATKETHARELKLYGAKVQIIPP